jgi:hypothetical protein
MGHRLPRHLAGSAAAIHRKAAALIVRHRGSSGPIGDMAMLGPSLVDSSQAGAPIAGVTRLVLDAE